MNLAPAARHVRWFHFVQSKLGDKEKYANGTNLCHFMRVTCLWPLIMGAPLAMMAAGLVIIFILIPYEWWGLIGIAIIWACTAAIPLSIYGLVLLIGRFGRYGGKFAPVGGMIYCAYQHALAVKGKFCPLVRFGEQTDPAA